MIAKSGSTFWKSLLIGVWLDCVIVETFGSRSRERVFVKVGRMSGMFTFQGDYKRRAQVNLGRTTHEDRATLLRKAQEERKARELQRRRELAAMKIQVLPSLCSSSRAYEQAFWRRQKQVACEKEKLRGEWDDLVLRDTNESSETWLIATRLFPFFYDKAYDGERAIRLLRWLTRSKKVVDNWLRSMDSFENVLIRIMSMLTKAVGSFSLRSQYNLHIWII